MRLCSVCHASYAQDERFCPLDGAPLTETGETGDPLIGRVLDARYRIVRPIGRGGMGAVYEAEHVALGKRVAIKLLLDTYCADAEVLARFQQEARAAARIGHENIVDISDVGAHAGRSYIVMEYLEGGDLARVLRRDGALPIERAVAIVAQICRGLAAAHRKGIIHRDMKPENVFLTERIGLRDFVKIMDFGISKVKDAHNPQDRLTQTGALLGTPLYMSPEQAVGATDIDHRVDVYATGVILFELVCGVPPFRAPSYLALLTQHLQEAPPPPRSLRPDLPPHVEHAILRALEKDRERRFASMEELEAGLTGITPVPRPAVWAPTGPITPSQVAGEAVPVGAAATVPTRPPRRGLIAAAVAASAAIVAAAVVGLVALARTPEGAGAAAAPPASAGRAGPLEGAASAGATGALDAGPGGAAPPVVTVGRLEIDSEPRGAQVTVDGRPVGATPTLLESIVVGDHELRLELAGHVTVQTRKVVRAGVHESFFAKLVPGRRPAADGVPARRDVGRSDGGAAHPGDAPRDPPPGDEPASRKDNPYLP